VDARGRGAAGDPVTVDAAGQVMTDPRVVEAVERLRPLAREADMTDAELHALVRTIGRSGGIARGAAGAAEASATVTRDMAPQLARRLGVDEIEIAGVAGEVGVHLTLRDRRVVAVKVVVGPSAAVGDVLAHRGIVEMLERYAVFTGAHEAFAEVCKYEAMIHGRMAAMAVQLARGEAAATSRTENEILVMAGELSYWRGVLDEVTRTDNPKLARGLIEAKDIGKVTAEAIAAGYPVLPSDRYHYRRWPGRGPEGQEFQVFRADANGPDPLLQPRWRGNGWVLEEAEGSGKVPQVFEVALRDDQVLAVMLAESQSLHAYVVALTNTRGIGLSAPAVQARMRQVIERVRTPRNATAAEIAAGVRRRTDEHKVLHALKAEFGQEFFACAARKPTPEAQLARFLAVTRNLNIADLGHLREDYLARRDPGSVQHVVVKHTDHPHLGLSARERHIDRVRADGTAVEVKSIKGKLSSEELAQLEDYKKMVDGKLTLLVAGRPMRIVRAMYEFTEPAGVRANLTIIEEQMLGQGVWVKVYNRRGCARILRKEKDLVGIEGWLAR
jgi:hypothetical protein